MFQQLRLLQGAEVESRRIPRACARNFTDCCLNRTKGCISKHPGGRGVLRDWARLPSPFATRRPRAARGGHFFLYMNTHTLTCSSMSAFLEVKECSRRVLHVYTHAAAGVTFPGPILLMTLAANVYVSRLGGTRQAFAAVPCSNTSAADVFCPLSTFSRPPKSQNTAAPGISLGRESAVSLWFLVVPQ